MQEQTIFRTPGVRHGFRWLFMLTCRLIGWKVVGKAPAEKKCILIAAPHTSNWDFPTMMVAAFVLGLDIHWMGKHTLFPKGPLGAIMRWFGGIPVDRRAKHNTVEQMVEHFRQRDALLVLITPEGTRSKVERWKEGFYHIARGAEVPIYLGFVDASKKETGLGPAFYPSGDVERDIAEIRRFYEGKTGFREHRV
ncbi:lysophospholipid acyltransferase family protein [Spongiibacter nanhainus]|uniref:Lysophospholipid acyltransferase family protein n=1 Tax=Spongiibacter nanhainus TaxID=2794344 RepID=A0A7T4USP1_9GAMM|nr:lysophospholipid acyltransferase family protein [Spongiibacter nanhainus]QQD19625.1 lysophospholipid acyltransferase family protein [Spongiibacter nanhainus]